MCWMSPFGHCHNNVMKPWQSAALVWASQVWATLWPCCVCVMTLRKVARWLPKLRSTCAMQRTALPLLWHKKKAPFRNLKQRVIWQMELSPAAYHLSCNKKFANMAFATAICCQSHQRERLVWRLPTTHRMASNHRFRGCTDVKNAKPMAALPSTLSKTMRGGCIKN